MMTDESDLAQKWVMMVERLPNFAQTQATAESFLTAVLQSLQETTGCTQVTYIRHCPAKSVEPFVLSVPEELVGDSVALLDLKQMAIREIAAGLSEASERLMAHHRTLRLPADHFAEVVEIRLSEPAEQQALCLSFNVAQAEPGTTAAMHEKALQFLTLLAYIARSKHLADDNQLRESRLSAVHQILSLTGNVRDVAKQVCLIWRQWLNVPALRLWVFNSSFKELELVHISCDEPYRLHFVRSANRMPYDSIQVEAIAIQKVIRLKTPQQILEWNSDPSLAELLPKLPYLICVPLIAADRTGDPSQPRFVGLIDLHIGDIEAVTQPDHRLLFVGKITAAAFLRARSYERDQITRQTNQFTIDLVNPRDRRRLNERKDDYLEKVKVLILKAVHAHCVSIFEADDARDLIRCVATTGIRGHDDFKKTVFYRADDSLTWRVFSTGDYEVSANINEWLDYKGKFPERRSLPKQQDHNPLLIHPLPGQTTESATGVIRVSERTCSVYKNRLQNFSDHDIDLIRLIAQQVSPSMLMIRLQAHRDLFVERTAHQVTQPLQGVLAYTDNILEGVYDRDPGKLKEKLKYIRQMAKAAAGMLRSTLWAAGITDFSFLKEIQRNPTKLTSYFLERVIDLQPIRKLDGIKVKFVNEAEADQWGDFLIDAAFFEQVVGNLLHNAVKYSYPHTTAEVKVLREARTLKVEITSTGVPIDLADPEQIFWDRERGKVASQYDPQGSGQGLYLARQIMRGFGGDVKLLQLGTDHMVIPPRKFPAAQRYTFQIIYPEAFPE